MAKNRFGEPEVLDSMAWIAMTFEARVQLAANKFLDNESKIRKRFKRYDGPTAGNVKQFVSSLFTIPYGQTKATVEGVLAAIGPQRSVREKRSKMRPYQPPKNKPSRKDRWTKVAPNLYGIYDSDGDRISPKPVGGATIGGCLVLVDEGRYRAKSRIYLRQKATGRVKVVVLEKEAKSITEAMLRLSSKPVYRGTFDGKRVTLDFDREGFVVDGDFHPWIGVRKVYRGIRSARNTLGSPRKNT